MLLSVGTPGRFCHNFLPLIWHAFQSSQAIDPKRSYASDLCTALDGVLIVSLGFRYAQSVW